VRLLGRRIYAGLAHLVGARVPAGRDDAVWLPRHVRRDAGGLRAASRARAIRDILPLLVHHAGADALHGLRGGRRLVVQVSVALGAPRSAPIHQAPVVGFRPGRVLTTPAPRPAQIRRRAHQGTAAFQRWPVDVRVQFAGTPQLWRRRHARPGYVSIYIYTDRYGYG